MMNGERPDIPKGRIEVTSSGLTIIFAASDDGGLSGRVQGVLASAWGVLTLKSGDSNLPLIVPRRAILSRLSGQLFTLDEKPYALGDYIEGIGGNVSSDSPILPSDLPESIRVLPMDLKLWHAWGPNTSNNARTTGLMS